MDTLKRQDLEKRTVLGRVAEDIAGTAYVVWMTAVCPPAGLILIGDCIHEGYKGMKNAYARAHQIYKHA
jgi:hypothetical protein